MRDIGCLAEPAANSVITHPNRYVLIKDRELRTY